MNSLGNRTAFEMQRGAGNRDPNFLRYGFNSGAKGRLEKSAIAVKNTALPSLDTLDHNCRDLSYSEKKAERLFTRQATKDKLVLLYQTAGLVEQAEKLKNCCKRFGTLKCSANHLARCYPTERCRLPLCPDCADFRARRAFNRLFPKFEAFSRLHKKDRLVLITLTLKNSSDNLLEIHRFIKKSFRKLRQRMSWKEKIRGGVSSFELTVSKTGDWHYHIHILAFRKSFERYEQSDLSDDWCKATDGCGFIVDIRQIRDLKGGLREVLKYSFKPVDVEKNRFDADKIRQFYELSRRGRLSEPFGEFYGLEVAENAENEPLPERLEIGSPCPTCLEPLEFVFVTREALEAFYLNPVAGFP